jgi:hypothetical protein
MARHSDPRGRFGIHYERNSIYDGIQSELTRTVGQYVHWLVFDPAASEEDSIYSVASSRKFGRQWARAIPIPVFGAFIYQGSSVHNDRGFYNTDTLLVSCVADKLTDVIPDVVTDPDKHISDRIAYRGRLFTPNTVSLLGLLQDQYTVISLECQQLNPEESVNDEQFTENQQPYHVIHSEDDEHVSDMSQ